ncbi:MAG: hypothetical protein HC904_15380 [Blastochloris sp.]|nr:hypothetical protein [Blastochloris sp.]
MKKILLSCGMLVLGAWAMTAQTPPAVTPIPPALQPFIKNIEAQYTPKQLLELVQKTSPTGWKLIQEKSKNPQSGGQGFSLADFEKVPESERQALMKAFQPIVSQAVTKMSTQEQMALIQSMQNLDANTLIVPLMGLAGVKGFDPAAK